MKKANICNNQMNIWEKYCDKMGVISKKEEIENASNLELKISKMI